MSSFAILYMIMEAPPLVLGIRKRLKVNNSGVCFALVEPKKQSQRKYLKYKKRKAFFFFDRLSPSMQVKEG